MLQVFQVTLENGHFVLTLDMKNTLMSGVAHHYKVALYRLLVLHYTITTVCQ